MLIILLTVVGLALNLSIAYLTAKDAHQRGHDRDKWFVISSVFGIFGIIVYLLTRNDRKIPESERQPKRSGVRLSYVGASVGGMIVLFIIGLQISPFLFPNPSLYDSCGGITGVTVSNNPSPSEPCEVSWERWDKLQEPRENRGTFQFVSGLSGIVLGPAGLYLFKNSSYP
jgi:hypothetical protein